MSVAILSPHLDDAVVSAWSALRSDGALVVNVFDGAPPAGTLERWDRVTGASDSRVRMGERLEEDREALALAGRESTSLGLLEAQYRDGPPDAAALDAGLRAALAEAGDVDELWAPAGIGEHADHVAVRDWALAAGPRVFLYADLPYAIRHGWPAWVTGEEPQAYFSQDEWWAAALPAGVELTPRAHELPEEEVELKLRALAAYRTQIEGIDGGTQRLLRNPKVIRYEVSWTVGAG
jgi:LmbE family N-acetylglucosaminyl deacetylase